MSWLGVPLSCLGLPPAGLGIGLRVGPVTGLRGTPKAGPGTELWAGPVTGLDAYPPLPSPLKGPGTRDWGTPPPAEHVIGIWTELVTRLGVIPLSPR